MHTDYRAMKAAARAQVANVDGETVLRRQYFDRDGTEEPIREDVLTIGYIARALLKITEELEDIKAMAVDFANVEEMTIQELKDAVAAAQAGL